MIWDDDFALEDYDKPQWSIWASLDELVVLWTEKYKSYWTSSELSVKDRADAKAARHIADVILPMISALSIAGAAERKNDVDVSKEDLKTLRRALRAQKDIPASRDWISLRLAAGVTNRAKGATDRAFRLVGILHGKMLSDRAAAYLARVSTLYTNGWELEAGMMCRSTLEAALLERLAPYFNGDREPPSLDKLLRLAGEHGVLDGYELAGRTRRGWKTTPGSMLHEADRIRRAGNYITHEMLSYPTETGALKDAFDAIRALVRVLQKLFPPAGSANT